MRRMRLALLAASVAAVVALAGCAGSTPGGAAPTGGTSAAASDAFPMTITHAFGKTLIESQPERVATVAWSNQEVPLALGVVPVGMAKATWGDDDGDGVLPWVEEKLEELDAETPVLFDETDSIDFEGVADTEPDVILAAYSGLTQEDYDTLSKIAPVIAYPGTAWTTSLAEMVRMDGEAIGLGTEADALVGQLEEQIAAAAPASAAGKSGLFAFIDATDLSKIGFYTPGDPRAALFEQIGMTTPAAVTDAENTLAEGTFYAEVSAEEAQQFDDVDVIVTYGDDTTLATLQADPLIGKIPAIAAGAVVVLPNSTPLAAAANPTPLSIGWGITDYTALIGEAADKAA